MKYHHEIVEGKERTKEGHIINVPTPQGRGTPLLVTGVHPRLRARLAHVVAAQHAGAVHGTPVLCVCMCVRVKLCES